MPSPGRTLQLMMWAHSEMRRVPRWYCFWTVLPMSMNLRSSKMRKLCFLARALRQETVSGQKSDRMSMWVFRTAM